MSILSDVRKPFDIGLNIAVHRMQEIICPLGYVVRNGITSLHELKEATTLRGGCIPVSDENNENSIYGSPEINLMQRAWHDAVHIKLNAEFTPDGEQRVFNYQIYQLLSQFPYEEKVGTWIKLLHADLIGAIKHQKVYGMFPVDQRRFVMEYAAYGEIVFTGNPY